MVQEVFSMRTTPKIRRVQLKMNQDNESVLLGIVSAEPDYKLSLALNRNLNISLRNSKPVRVNDIHGNELIFSRFSDSSSSVNLVYDLTSNKSGKNYLIRKLRNIDYILRIYDPDNEINADNTISVIRATECITAVFNIDTGSVKDKNLNYLI